MSDQSDRDDLAGVVDELNDRPRKRLEVREPDRAALRSELGFDAAFDYHDASVEEQLRAAAPDGIDVFFDNVGGDHLEAAIATINDFGRIVLCGAIAGYNDERPANGPRNLYELITKRITARGFIVLDHMDRMPAFLAEMEGWITGGEIVHRETVVEGLDRMPNAFLGLFRGDNLGKMVVTLPPRD